VTTSPIDRGAAALGKTTATTATTKKTTTSSGTVDLTALFKIAQSQNTASAATVSASKGAVYTKQDADAAVQSVYQSLLGRNAVGTDYAKAIKLIMAQSQDTAGAGRAQALTNTLMDSPEYKIKQDNKYLDVIYNAVAADVRKAQV